MSYEADGNFKIAYEAQNLRAGLVKCYYPPSDKSQRFLSYGWEKKEKCTLLLGHWVRTLDLQDWEKFKTFLTF